MNLKRLIKVKDSEGNQLVAQTFFVCQNTDKGPTNLFLSSRFDDAIEHLQYYQRNYKEESFFLKVVFDNNDFTKLQ